MTSLRQRRQISFIAHDGHRLTRHERRLAGIAERPVMREQRPPDWPQDISAFVWFALAVKPQTEAKVVIALDRAGFVAVNPVEMVPVRSNRQSRHKRGERARALMTSYVMFGYPGRAVCVRDRRRFAADVPWFNVLETPNVVGCIGINGLPCPFPLAEIVRLQMLHARHGRPRNWAPELDQPAVILRGGWANRVGKVISFADGKARVHLAGLDKGVLAHMVDPVIEVPEGWLGEVLEAG